MPARRKPLRRRGSRRPRFGAWLVALVLFAALVVVIVVVARQFSGYFAGHRAQKHVAVVVSPSPTAAPTGLPTIAPSPAPSGSSGPKVAIIIDDCGYSVSRDLRFLDLKIPVTLSILPMTPHGRQVESAAKAAGIAVMLHIPMEPESQTAHPGPGEITTTMTDDQVRAQLAADIASLSPLPGANNHMGSKATSDPRVMRDVLGVLKSDDMYFIDSMTAMTSVGASTARELGVPTAERDVFLDDEVTVPYVEAQIRLLETVARRKGVAIAIGHPNPATAQALEAMVPQMVAQGFTFVDAQSLVK